MHQYLDLCRYVLENGTEKPDLVAFRADRKPWIVAMPLDVFLKALGNAVDPLQIFPIMYAIKIIDDWVMSQ